jgi:hypothetical protein
VRKPNCVQVFGGRGGCTATAFASHAFDAWRERSTATILLDHFHKVLPPTALFLIVDESSAIQKLSRNEVLGNEGGTAPESLDFFQPTIQPTICDVLYDFRVVWQSPRSCKFYKSQGKKHPLRLEIFLLRNPPDRARSVLTYRAMCPVAGQCDPVVWAFSTSGFHLFFATKPVSSETSKAERGQIWRP